MKKKLLSFSAICGLSICTAVAQTNLVPNGNFENWTSSTYYIPKNFSQCSNPQAISDSLPINEVKTTDKYHGKYAIQLTTETSTQGDTVPAYFINIDPNNGNSPTSWHGGFPYDQKPNGIRGWYKYNVSTADSATVIVAFSKGGKNIHTYKYQIGGLKNNYTLFDFPLNPPLSALGLPNNNISALQADSKGNVWAGTNGGGVSKFDGTHWKTYTSLNGLGSDSIHSISIDTSNGNVWVGTTNGLSEFNGNSWVNYTTTNGLADNDVRGTQMGSGGSLWIGTYGGGVSRFKSGTWTTFTKASTSNGLVNDSIRPVKIDANGNKWFGTKKGVSQYNGTSWTSYTTTNGLANNDVRAIQTDKKGNLWFGTNGGGVSKFNGTNWVTFNTTNGLANNYVSKILVDPQNNLWFGTNAGISVFDSATSNWTTYNKSNGLIGDSIQGLTMDNQGNIWVGTPEGISIYNGSSWSSITSSSSTTPDSVVFAALSCKFGTNGQPTGPPGSTLKLDSVSFTGVASQPALFDEDFELWDSTTVNLPNNWFLQYSGGNLTGFNRTTDVPNGGGNYAIELTTFLGNQHNHPAAQAGQISKGYSMKKCNNNCKEQGGIPYNKQIDTLAFYYKYAPSGNDSAQISLAFIKDDTTIAQGNYGINLHAASSYQYKEIPFSLSQKPDSVIISIQSSAWGDTAFSFIGSDLKVDNIHFKSQYVSHSQSPTICNGKSLVVGNSTYTISGTSVNKLVAYQGYDSIVTTHLTVLPVNTFTQSPNTCSITVGTHTYSVSGTYTTTLTAISNGCDSIVTTHLTVPTTCATAIANISAAMDVIIYPNPISTIATIEIGSAINITGAELRVVDVYGKTIKKISITSYTTSFNRSDLASGIYFYELITNEGIKKTGKLLIE